MSVLAANAETCKQRAQTARQLVPCSRSLARKIDFMASRCKGFADLIQVVLMQHRVVASVTRPGNLPRTLL